MNIKKINDTTVEITKELPPQVTRVTLDQAIKQRDFLQVGLDKAVDLVQTLQGLGVKKASDT